MIEKIVSDGQTGVDLAALDAAIAFGIPHGGWCPKGRTNLDGVISAKYQFLKEISGNFKTDKENRNARTKANIKDSDGTLTLAPKLPLPREINDGTVLTIEEAKRQKPHLEIDLSKPSSENIKAILSWISTNKIKTLNIAGPAESTCEGIYRLSSAFLEELLLI
jgi:Circularly permutated YpsA SLOG family